ncbi:MAG: DUF3311 domain-containing protein [Planctomycetota bacterium]|nr:DUF3311 domain-containing protein [Planctomycetota bacterium]
MKWLLFALIVAMVAIHQDFWWWKDSRLVLGILPVGLAYHVFYALLCSAMMWLLVKTAWPKELDELAPPAPKNPGD